MTLSKHSIFYVCDLNIMIRQLISKLAQSRAFISCKKMEKYL